MATNAAFVAALQGITVTGVTRHFDQPPASIGKADLPAAFPYMPNGGIGERSVSCRALDKVRAMRFVICLAPVGTGTQSQNYGALAAAMDNLETALDALEVAGGGTLANFIEYDIAAEIVEVGGNDYWGVVAEVRARDT